MPRLPDPRERPWLTVAEMAAIAFEGEKVIRAAMDAGQLPLLQVGRYKRVPTAAVWRLVGLDPRDFQDTPDMATPGPTSPGAALTDQESEVPGDDTLPRPLRAVKP